MYNNFHHFCNSLWRTISRSSNYPFVIFIYCLQVYICFSIYTQHNNLHCFLHLARANTFIVKCYWAKCHCENYCSSNYPFVIFICFLHSSFLNKTFENRYKKERISFVSIFFRKSDGNIKVHFIIFLSVLNKTRFLCIKVFSSFVRTKNKYFTKNSTSESGNSAKMVHKGSLGKSIFAFK